eukprot:XP_008178239.1 PREDICTED: piggyBac transposable element-derived protein 4-like [Acyrthosiphon pisum]
MSSQKKRRVDSTLDPSIVENWLNELSSCDEMSEADDESDNEEIDTTQKSDHESESEQDISENETNENVSDVQNNNFYLGKDKTTKWKKNKPNMQIRVRSHNIITHLPGPKQNARNAKFEIDCLKLFINENVIRLITISTNIYIESIKANFQRESDARLTDEREINAFIGILFLIGALRCARKNAHQIWDNSRGSGVEACYLAMSEKRFRFLVRCIRFDDINNRNERREIDKLAPIREVFEYFIANFQNNFIASEYLTVDEQLLAFRGRCSFKQYIPSKPAKYGLKIFALVDAKTAYTFNLEAYVGTQPEGPYKCKNSGEDIVLRIVQPVEGSNRNITADNWFTSTIRKNKRELPSEFLPNKNRELHSSIFGFQEDYTLVSYCPKKNKAVLVVSSMHNDDTIDEENHAKKPEMITFYNKTKIGVDLVDQLCEKYNVARNTRSNVRSVLHHSDDDDQEIIPEDDEDQETIPEDDEVSSNADINQNV